MNTLVTPLQVLKLAFGEGEYLPPEIIAEADIAGAEQRYIVPVVGRALYEKLLGGSYPDFTSCCVVKMVSQMKMTKRWCS